MSKNKSVIKKGNKILTIEDLVKEVNKFDKSCGIKLKNPEIWNDPFHYFNVISAKADMNLGALICIVNGIEVSDYFETDNEYGYGTICKPIGVGHAEFTSNSLINWESKHNNNTSSLIFRVRYLSLVLSQFMGNMEDIVKRECDEKYKYKHSIDERRIMITQSVMNDLIRFINIMIDSEVSYQNIILKIHEHMSYTKKKLNHQDLRNTLNRNVLNIRDGMKTDLLTERFLTDDLAIFDIMKVAYILATNKTNTDVLPKFKHIEGATVKHDLLSLIEDLGFQICSNVKGRKYSQMFKAYIESKPSIWTEFGSEAKSNYTVQIGLLALSYAGFVINDKSVDKFIGNMMKKGK